MKLLVVVLVVVFLATSIVLIGCEEEPEKIVAPQPPPPPPPDPPPPPQGSSLARSSMNATPVMMPDLIARNVLNGEYGPELQRLLADEIATCINQMSSEGVVSVAPGTSSLAIDLIEDRGRRGTHSVPARVHRSDDPRWAVRRGCQRGIGLPSFRETKVNARLIFCSMEVQ
jgi:hypothetical protein